MQINPVQSTNNYYKPAFKAYFVANKNFDTLWRNANKNTYSLERYIKNLSEHYKGHRLEIIDTKDVSADDHHCTAGVDYTIYNYGTDKTHVFHAPYVCAFDMSGRLEAMLWELFCDSEFWGEGRYSKSEMFYASGSYEKENLPLLKLYRLLTERQ